MACWAMSQAETAAKIALLREHGMQVADPSPELTSGLQEIGRAMAEEWVAESGAGAASIVDGLAHGGSS